MTEEAYGITTYCDDIRQEVGGKLTLVGCYSNEMTVFGAAPAALPIFCAIANLRVPITQEFRRIEFALSQEFDGVQKEILRDGFDAPIRTGGDASDSPSGEKATDRQFSIVFPMKIAPLLIEGDGLIRCRAYIDGTEIRLGSLKVKVQALEEVPDAH